MAEQESDFFIKLKIDIENWIEGEEGSSHKWSHHIKLAPDLFHLLCKLTIEKDVPVEERARIGGAIAYFVTPYDLVPEALVGPGGFIDDVALAALVLKSTIKTSSEVIDKHWSGDEDVSNLVQDVLKDAETMLGSGLWGQLQELV